MALSTLRELRIDDNEALQVTAAELCGMLERMPGLNRLSLGKGTARTVTAAEWVQLARAWPEVQLEHE